GEGREDGVEAGPVRKPRVDQRAGPVDPQTERGDDLLDEMTNRPVVEGDGQLTQRPVPFDPNRSRPVDHDLGDRVVGQQGLDGAETQGPGGGGAHAANRSAVTSDRGSRDSSSPASTQRAMRASWGITALTGTSRTDSMSFGPSDRPGSSTRTTPEGRSGV